MARFKATKEQIQTVFATAVNASYPVGMGKIHFQARDYTPDEFTGAEALDYFAGRMVKLHPRPLGDDTYEIREPLYDPNDPERTYQSWGAKYPTAAALIEAAGLAVLKEGE